MAALEAMASARAIVATQTEAVAECVDDAACLVAADHPSALAEALLELLSSKQYRQRLVVSGVARARSLKWETPALRMGEFLAQM
jgi:glycosyltransferase involved in cell wall biosynthesis